MKDFVPSKVENLSELLFTEGKVQKPLGKLAERRLECIEEFKLFGGAEAMLSEDAKNYPVYLSE